MAGDKPPAPRYESLKDLISLPGSTTSTPAYPGYLKMRYVKLEKPLYKNGVAIYWDEVPLRKEHYEDCSICLRGLSLETMKRKSDE